MEDYKEGPKKPESRAASKIKRFAAAGRYLASRHPLAGPGQINRDVTPVVADAWYGRREEPNAFFPNQ